MPVTPSQARKFAVERTDLIQKIDEAIIKTYTDSPAGGPIHIDISSEVYNNKELRRHIEDAYVRAGWEVHFGYDDKASDEERAQGLDYTYYHVILTEKGSKKP